MNTPAFKTVFVLAIACVAVHCAASHPQIGDTPPLPKYRILVDKVMQPEAGWVTQERMVKAAVDAGFNVFCPRWGHERFDEVRKVAGWCDKHGIDYMPWMRGSLAVPKGTDATGKKLVWANGAEQTIWSPNADELWEWTVCHVVEYAKIGARNRRLIGVFLDYENYSPGGKQGNCYSLSYDDTIMAEFARAENVRLPQLNLSKRKTWLEQNGLHSGFSRFQITRWRDRCRALRTLVDEHNPDFRFCVYPAPGTPFIVEAVYREWSTNGAPLILADASTYGRSSRFAMQADALKENREKLLHRMEIPKNAGIPFVYLGGIDPLLRGADPEFSGKNAVAVSEAADGYWVFYEGPNYGTENHASYWKWLTWANHAISDGRFVVQNEPRETPEDWGFGHLLDKPATLSQFIAGSNRSPESSYPTVKLRGENMLLIAAEAGVRVELILQHHPEADYESVLGWELRDPRLLTIASGRIEHGRSDTITFTPEHTGSYLLSASAGLCSYSVSRSTVSVGLYAGRWLWVIDGADRLYFSVPRIVKEFTIDASGEGSETIRLNLFDPRGELAGTAQTSFDEAQVQITASASDYEGRTWALQITEADEGVLEDGYIRLDARLPTVLSLRPEEVFVANPSVR